MNVLKIIQTLTLATLLVLALSACSNKDNNDGNATEQTTGTSQAGGEDGIANTASNGGTTNSTGTTTSSGGGTQSTGGGSTDANSNDFNNVMATGSDSGNTDSSISTENNSNNTSDDNTVEDNTINQDNNASADNNTTQNTDDNTSTENNNTNNTENNTTNQDNNASADNNTTQNTDNNTSTETNSTVDVTPPVLTLNGKASITLQQNAVYTELGATAVDAVDGNLTVSISGAVDTSTVGNYTLTYTATDSAGNEANVTRSVEVVNTTPILTSITLESNATTVNVGDTVQLTVTGTYSDGSSATVDKNITYTISPTENVEVNGSVFKAKKDGNVTVQASIDGVNSNTIVLNITWVVNGHVLPPEPDKALNDSTLLGIDVNDNGVRDDVERWIYEEYKDKHPIHVDIGMQAAKAWQKVLEDSSKAKEIYPAIDAASSCEAYFEICIEKNNKLFVSKDIIDYFFVENMIFNTEARKKEFIIYDTLLSGDSYTIPWCSEKKELCDFDISKYGE